MSNPVSNLPDRSQSAASEPDVEVDESTEAGAALSEVATSDDASEAEAETETEEEEEARSSGYLGVIALLLGLALLASVAVNLKLSGDVSSLSAQGQELERALGAAVERIDVEAARATSAEAALDRVDSAVDVVNERVLGLQEALDQLRQATVRD